MSCSKTKLLFCFLLCLNAQILFAQAPIFCREGNINAEDELRASQYLSRNQNGRGTSPNFIVRVFFHVFTDDDGTNAAATVEQIASEFDSLTSIYSTSNICFMKVGEDFINNTTINNNFNANTDSTGSAFTGYKTPNCINIFYLKKIGGTNNSCPPPCGIGGIAFSGPADFCLVAETNIKFRNTVAHEVGHCLGLMHTFNTRSGIEKISGSNSTTAGDKVADTEADPYSFAGSACYSASSSCNYTGTCTDPDGATNYSPPYYNLMAYWGCGNARVITSGQLDRCYSFLPTSPKLVPCLSSTAPYVLSSSNVNSGFNIWTATNISTSGTNTITSSAQAIIGANRVVISPGFRATPTSGYTRIISTDCQ